MALPATPVTTLSGLLAEFIDVSNCPATPITGLSLDSREVSPGDLFIALKGTQTDGGHYIAQAVKQGAVAVLIETGEEIAEHGQLPVPVIAVPKLREFVSDIAGAFYAHPSRQMTVTAITVPMAKPPVLSYWPTSLSCLESLRAVLALLVTGQLLVVLQLTQSSNCSLIPRLPQAIF